MRKNSTTAITGSAQELKRNIVKFLNEKDIRCEIGAIIETDKPKVTHLFMEMETARLEQVKNELIDHLREIYRDDIIFGEWDDQVSEAPLRKSRIRPTLGNFSKTSSGYEESLEEDGMFILI